jgi:predicted DNA-binding transcriptional regulator AlpA
MRSNLPIEPLLAERDAAKILGVSQAWLARKRWEGQGPAFIRYGRAVRYERSALERYIQSRRINPEESGA